MNRLTIALIIAQNGLKAAAGLLTGQAKQWQNAADKESDAKKKAELLAKAKRRATLAKTLNAADAGIATYLAEE